MEEKGFFSVGYGHELYFEIWGNPTGIPVVFLHGGPGMGFFESDKNFFDANRYRVLFFDQRGSGRSKPFGAVTNNTTDLLVKDINALTERFQFEKFFIFGGSWGSTLALIYAIRNPSRVLGLQLRGIFLANKSSIDHYIGGGTEKFFPSVWNRLKSLVPLKEQEDMVGYYYKQMCSKEPKIVEQFAYEWARYELSIYKLNLSEKMVLELLQSIPYQSLSKLEAHFISNNCFIPEEYILNNCDELSDIPTSIVHGRYDMICPPLYAHQLHNKLKISRLHLVTAGHAASEPKIENKLIEELELMVAQVIT